MSERGSYAPGVPCWVDLSTPDTQGATGFYGALFGWRAGFDAEPEAHGYGMFHLRGKKVAGIGPLFHEDLPAGWHSYVAVSDLAETLQKAGAAGGRTAFPPTRVTHAGTMAGLRDRENAFLLLWQPEQHQGCEVVNEPGAFAWSELNTRDPAAAQEFYPAVFGWNAGGDAYYTRWQLEDKAVAGMLPMPVDVPAEVPPGWVVYFAVEDVEESAAKAKELGGGQTSPFIDSPAGRLAMFHDPWHAQFAMISGVQEHH
ncbi:VOC family protein [Actinocorallia aurantiaca]|uniref:VOC family protein n=1 Tax=Actinocorallia aurantiaca TaxID=46204 RepID=A0ABP6GFN8_9ACTN